MFIYPYAPGNAIALDYFVENVLLFHRGLTQIIVDMLITNKSVKPINELHVLFPNKMQNITYNKREDRYDYISLGEFSDITHTFIDNNIEHKKRCTLYNTTFIPIQQRSPGVTKVIADAPNLLSPFVNVQYQGEIKGKSHLSFYKDLGPIKSKVLHDLGFSLFTCNFETPIALNEPRWMRWNIWSSNTSNDFYSRNEYLRKRLTNDVNLSYIVQGPINVKELLITRIECYIKECELDSNNSELKKHATELKEIIVNNGFNMPDTNTVVTDCQLYLFPQDFQEVNNSLLTGDVALGYSVRLSKKQVIQYKSGIRNVKCYFDGLFSIKFEAKHRSKFVSYLPIISLILALIGISLRFILQ